MKIVSWNLNSIRARMPHVLKWVDENEFDVLCLQETKVSNDQFPKEELEERGLHLYIHGQKAYNGVAFISKHPLEGVEVGFPEGDMNNQKRVIEATLNGVRIINIYAPKGEAPTHEKYVMKRAFYKRLIEMATDDYDMNEDHVLICGDYNICPEAKDTNDPVKAAKKCMFLDEEVSWIKALLNTGMVDTFRQITDESRVFSWWDYRKNSFENNKGMRIDHVFVSDALSKKVKDAGIDPTPRGWERPSDHVPVWTEFDI